MNALRPYASLGRRGELRRLRRLAGVVLRRFGIDDAGLTVLRHEHNTTFRVDTATGRYVLRLNRTGVHDERTIASEMAWLAALAEGTNLGVPVPVAARDGSLVVSESAVGVPERRLGVLLRWQVGRFVDRRLTPRHLASVGDLIGQLQRHALRWSPPRGFARPRVDVLTAAARRASVAGPPEEGRRGVHPTPDDEASALALIARLLGEDDRDVVADALWLARRSTAALAGTQSAWGLIHADLHYENFLFHEGRPGRSTSTTAGGAPTSTTSRFPSRSSRAGRTTRRFGARSWTATRASDRYPVGSTTTSMPWRSCGAFS